MDTGTESDAELRRRVVEAVRSGLVTGREVIEELGISSGVLGGWCRAEDARRVAGKRLRTAQGTRTTCDDRHGGDSRLR